MHAENWRRISPGVYVDAAGALHLVDAELLAAHGYADTPENRATLREAAHEAMRGVGGTAEDGAPVIVVPAGKDDRRS